MSSRIEEYISRVLTQTSLNVTAEDLQTTEYKHVLRYLYVKHILKLKTSQVPRCFGRHTGIKDEYITYTCVKTLGNPNTKDELNNKIRALKSVNNSMYLNVFNTRFPGIGPGELVLYLLVDDATLTSAGSGAGDINSGNKKYEIKAGEITGDKRYVKGFFTGRKAFPGIEDILKDLAKLAKDNNLEASTYEIKSSVIKQLREKDPKRFLELEDAYAKAVSENYFNKPLLVLASKNSSQSEQGTVFAVKQKTLPSDIVLYEVTQNNVKPHIKI